MEKDLKKLLERLKEAGGANLKAVVLYGSAVAGDFHPAHSNLNVLVVLERVGASELERLKPVARWWERRGNPAPLVFTLEELRRSADVFSIELLDIKAAHLVLFGEDCFAGLDVPMELHNLQVERELGNGLVRLRQHYLAAPRDRKNLLGLMTVSVSSFVSLFRHAVIALEGGQTSPAETPIARTPKREVIDRLARLVDFDGAPFRVILDVREGKRVGKDVDVEATFRAYLEAITRLTQEVDRRLERR